MKTAIITLTGSIYKSNVMHAIVDLCTLAGYDLPWRNDDVTYSESRDKIVLVVYPGWCEDSLTHCTVRDVSERWGVPCTLEVEDDEEVDE